MLALTGIELYTPTQVIPQAMLVIQDGRIQESGPARSIPGEAQELRLEGRRILPGFIDLHTHGLLGKDAFSRELGDVIRNLPRYGVTSFLAATVTMPWKTVLTRLDEMRTVLNNPPAGAHCAGIHIEGNFLSRKRTGMANPDWCQPLTREAFTALQEAAGGWIRMVTFAPEEGDSMECIPWLLEQGVIPSIGHSAATYEQALEAIQLGVAHATHMYNAMSPLHHRAPGVVGAVLTSPGVSAELIADGQHVHPGAMRLLLQSKGAAGICLISDSAPFAGLPDGTYPWEGYTLIIQDGTCRLPDGTLAGASVLVDTGFRTLVQDLGIPAEQAMISACEAPARCMGWSGRKGQLLPGFEAELVVMDDDWQVERTLVAGETVWERNFPENR